MGSRRNNVFWWRVCAAALLVCMARAEVITCAFESAAEEEDAVFSCGGRNGGAGRFSVLRVNSNIQARVGQRAACLEVWGDGSPGGVAWAALSRDVPSDDAVRIHASVWVRGVSPPRSAETKTGHTTAQLFIEYFRDKTGTAPHPSHVTLSIPVSIETALASNDWVQIEVGERFPPGARMARVSVILSSIGVGKEVESILVDDLQIRLEPRRRPPPPDRKDTP